MVLSWLISREAASANKELAANAWAKKPRLVKSSSVNSSLSLFKTLAKQVAG